MTTKPAKTDRKPSRVYEDLAWMIILPKHPSAMSVLRFLAEKTNDSGTCFPSYSLLSAVCGGIAKSTISDSLQYLYSVGVLTLLKRGYGNKVERRSNKYKLHLIGMQRLVVAQGVFNVETTKCLLHGAELEARIKYLSDDDVMATLMGEILESAKLSETTYHTSPAELPETTQRHSGRSSEQFVRSPEQVTKSSERFTRSSETNLTLCNQPSGKATLCEKQPSTEPTLAHTDLLSHTHTPVQPPSRDEVSPSVPPLSSVRLPSAQCAPKPNPPAPKPAPMDREKLLAMMAEARALPTPFLYESSSPAPAYPEAKVDFGLTKMDADDDQNI